MANLLESLCKERGIAVDFIKHNFIDDPTEPEYIKPVIKVHTIFKECPAEVAEAIVSLFTGNGSTADGIATIEGYLIKKFGNVGIRVKPPKILKSVTAKKEEKSPGYDKDRDSGNEPYIEAVISSIEVTNLKGEHKVLNANEIFSIKDPDVFDMDVVVRPPNT
jgi:hypothetical protein